jgi:hypothetical protein
MPLMLSLALNLALTGLFILIVKPLMQGGRIHTAATGEQPVCSC